MLATLVGTVTACQTSRAAEGSFEATALRQQYATLRALPGQAPLGPTLVLQASQSPGRVQGDVYAVVDRPYEQVRPALDRIDRWCRLLTLNLVVKYCRAAGGGAESSLTIGVAPRQVTSLSRVNWLRFVFAAPRDNDQYLEVVLSAPQGPFGTSDYRMRVEVTPVEGRSLLHLHYAYSFGLAADLALKTYLTTLGRDKVGFSVVDRQADGQPIYVKGLRGIVERDVMRYFLAIEAYLGAQRLPLQEQFARSLQDWFDAAERYPRQLHEIERGEYLEMKLRLAEQQQASPGW
jgi:hypothetical protein